MNTINNYQNTTAWYTRNSTQSAGTQQLGKKHYHNIGQIQSKDTTKNNTIDTLDSLVSSITQNQNNTLNSAINSMQAQAAPSDSTSTDPLAGLVSAGTITQDQEDAVKEALDSAINSMQSQAVPDNSSTTTDPLAGLVSAGTITQDQEDAVMNAFNVAQTAYLSNLNTVYSDSDFATIV